MTDIEQIEQEIDWFMGDKENEAILVKHIPDLIAEVERLREGINFALSYTRPTPHTDDPWMACREFIVEYLKELIE
tara:strand:+ start:2492 stop:2719 length:228 start_codon:yes stop_codon:yes gene_type:complete